jgi:putative amidase-like protein
MRLLLRNRVAIRIAGSLAALLFVFASAAPAFAYNGGTAASYADTYWNNYNTNKYKTMNADCTNFVSQSMHAGGFSFVNAGQDSSNDNNWWYQWGPFGQWSDSWSNSWVLVTDQYNFLMWHYPGGYNYGTKSATTNSSPPNGLSKGDVLYYDWDNSNRDGAYLDHATIQTALQGYDPTTGWFGDLVDAHQTNHYHAIWTLEPYMSATQASTTMITLVHVSSANT